MRNQRRPALRKIALVTIAAWGSMAYAAGLGSLRVHSALGQPLRVAIPVLGDHADLNANCVRARVEHTDGALITGAQVAFSRSGSGMIIHLATHHPINEPAVALKVDVACGSTIQRTYQVLLDPVVILPQVSQSDRAATGNVAASRAPAELPMVAPATTSSRIIDKPRRTVSRNQQTNSTAQTPADIQLQASKTTQSKSAQTPPKKAVRNVLKLTGEDVAIDINATFSPGLKLSDTLSESRDTGDPVRAEELRNAQARFAAILRGEDPVQNSEQQLKAMQARLQELEQQTAQIRQKSEQQRQADLTAMNVMRREMVPSGWLVGIGALLLAALGAAGWLAWRLQDVSRRSSAAIWEKTISRDDREHTETGTWDDTLSAVTISDDPPDVPTQQMTAPPEPQRASPFEDTLTGDWDSQLSATQEITPQNQDTLSSGLELAPPVEVPISGFARHVNDASASDEALVGTATTQPAIAGRQQAPKEIAARASNAAASSPAIAPAHGKLSGIAAGRVQRSADVNQLQVGEVSDLMQEAEFWMLLNDAERAIEILEPYAGVKDPVSPVPWIYLLDLYRVSGERTKYGTLAARIQQVFNTSVPAYDEEVNYQSAKSLEDYPHVVQAIQDLWESDAIIPYLESLLFDERDGARNGFDLAVYRELIHLIGVACDPNVARRRSSLRFGKSQPRQISQQVMGSSDKTEGQAQTPAASESSAFDKAMAQEATIKQVLPKLSVPKPAMMQPVSREPELATVRAAPAQRRISETAASPVNEQEPVAVTAGSVEKVPAPSAAMPAATVPAPDRKSVTAPVTPTPVIVPAITADTLADAAPTVEDAIKAMRTAFAEKQKPVAESQAEEDQASEENADHAADMARKLDLSVAYQEIGENVGARVLLEEVIQGGTPLQVDKAKAMLKKLLKEIDWQ